MEISKENGTFFRRKEKKFLVDSKTYFTLKKIFDEPKGKFKRDHLAPKTEFTYIENIYLDSPDLNSYHQSIKDQSDRFKLRIRSYAQDFVKDDDRIFLEVKGKEIEATVKKRVAFKSEWLDRFLIDGAYPIDDFVFLNEDKEPTKSLEIISYISRLIRNFKYKPILSSNYLRYAYRLRGTKDIRITIDRDLKFNPLVKNLRVELPYAGVISGDQFIFEIKYLDEEMLLKIPEIMNLLGQPCKFSKYNFGVYSSYLNKRSVAEPKWERLPSNAGVGAISHALGY